MKIAKMVCAIFCLAAMIFEVEAASRKNNAPPPQNTLKNENCEERPFRIGWFMGINGGPNILCTSSHDGQRIGAYTGYSLGWEGGYRWRPGIRLEIEEVYRHNNIESIHYLGSNINAGGHVWSLSTLVNVICEIPGFSQWWLTPYVGAGGGYAHQNIQAKNFSLSYSGDKNGAAWQAIAGMGCWFHTRADFAFEYRYRQGPVTYLFDQTIQGALKYHF